MPGLSAPLRLTNGQRFLTIGRVADEQPYQPADILHLSTDEQLRALNNLVRHRILGVLREAPATISQVATRLNLLKGSSSYHLRLLERAGLVRVVATRRVRGVTERYYAPTARRIVVPTPGQPTTVLRHALADLAAPGADCAFVRLQYASVGAREFDEFSERLDALLDDLADASDPNQPAVTLAVAFFRPGDSGEPDPRTGAATHPAVAAPAR